jgi:uncharacterized caspase-like protein
MAIHRVLLLLLAVAINLLSGIGSGASAAVASEACRKYDADVAAGKPARRVALSIGNNDPKGGVNNAANDSKLIATTLRDLGWDVTQISNTTREGMLAALQQLRAKTSDFCPSDIVLFYFAGNGLEVNRVSYFGGTDSDKERLEKPKSFDDQLEALKTYVNTNHVLAAIEHFEGAKFIVLDTCRDNPFQNARTNLEQFAAPRLPNNTFFAYASEPGDNAADFGPDDPNHGPYALSLSRKLKGINGSAEEVFRQVRLEVIDLSAKPGAAFNQRPFVESSLQEVVYLGRPPELRALTGSSSTGAAQRGPEKRIALLIANGRYDGQNALDNPPNDVEYVSSVLRTLGFEVFVQSNLIGSVPPSRSGSCDRGDQPAVGGEIVAVAVDAAAPAEVAVEVLGGDAPEAGHPCLERAGVGVDVLDVITPPDVLTF